MDSRGGSLPMASTLGLLVGLGLAAAGYFIGKGIYHVKMADRYVTVRGLVERPVKADLAVWTIAYTVTGDDVTALNKQIDAHAKLVGEFVHNEGFSGIEIERMPTRITDKATMGFQQETKSGRYIIKGGVKIRSVNVDRVRQASQLTGQLIEKGVVLNLEPEGTMANPAYFFTKLDSIRPSMLVEATNSARQVAERFALDSKSRLGAIRRANQGVFEVMGRDASGSQNFLEEQSSIDKKVRLVSTIEYYLLD